MSKCPINCGECCAEWAYVEVIWTPERRDYLDRDDPCPNLGSGGCILPRDQRPKLCLDHLCERALAMLKSKEP